MLFNNEIALLVAYKIKQYLQRYSVFLQLFKYVVSEFLAGI
jgi:hypothetical protein